MSKLLTKTLKNFLHNHGLRQTELISLLDKKLCTAIKKATFNSWLSDRTPRYISEEEIYSALKCIKEDLDDNYEGQWVKKETVANQINSWIERGLSVRQIAIILSVSRQFVNSCKNGEHRFPAKKWRRCFREIESYIQLIKKSN